MDNKETSNITVEYYHTLEDKQITISLEEYKELLIIKGKYEELKSQQGYLPEKPTITYTCGTGNAGLEYTYKVTY